MFEKSPWSRSMYRRSRVKVPTPNKRCKLEVVKPSQARPSHAQAVWVTQRAENLGQCPGINHEVTRLTFDELSTSARPTSIHSQPCELPEMYEIDDHTRQLPITG